MLTRNLLSALPSSLGPLLYSGIKLAPPSQSIRMASTLPRSPFFQALSKHDSEKPAIVHSDSGRTFTYGSLLHDVAAAKSRLSETANGNSLTGQRIAFLAENGYDYVGRFHDICSEDSRAD